MKNKFYLLSLSILLCLSLLCACVGDPSTAGNDEGQNESETSDINETGNSNGTTGQIESSKENDSAESNHENDSTESNEQEEPMGPKNVTTNGFKIIGYMPNWYSKSVLEAMPIEQYTHINYAFAIPKDDGTVRDLPNPDFVQRLLEIAHENNVQVLLSVGGWSYNDVVLEPTFVAATETLEEAQFLAENIVTQALEYGFDGVDLDWEHPNTSTAAQYEMLVSCLHDLCQANGLALTCAVVGTSGMDAGITDEAAAKFDWINVMGYDGGEGADHSPMSLAVDYITYWTEKRGIAPEKVTLGVPFYERPSWNAYSTLITQDPDNANKDTTEFQGKTVYYNGVETMKEKTKYALEHAGGIMVWQITLDTADESLSLLQAIRSTLIEAGVLIN